MEQFNEFERRLADAGENIGGKVYQRHLEEAQNRARAKAQKLGETPNRTAAERVLAIRNVSVTAIYTAVASMLILVVLLLLVNEVIAAAAGLVPFLGMWKSYMLSFTLVAAYLVLLFVAPFVDAQRGHATSERPKRSVRIWWRGIRYFVGWPPEGWQEETYTAAPVHLTGILRLMTFGVVLFSMLGRLLGVINSAELATIPALDGALYLVQNVTLFELIGSVGIAIITWGLLQAVHFMMDFITADFERLTGGVEVGAPTPQQIYEAEMIQWYNRRLLNLRARQETVTS